MASEVINAVLSAEKAAADSYAESVKNATCSKPKPTKRQDPSKKK